MSKMKRKIALIYDVQQGERISDAKCIHILRRIDPLIVFFKLLVSANFTQEQAAKQVSQGSVFSAAWIEYLAREFIRTTARKRVTVYSEDKDGNTISKRVWQVIEKPHFKFATFQMGCNRRVESIMNDESICARATVWLRLNKGKKKGKRKLKAEDFQRYLQNDLLKETGEHIYIDVVMIVYHPHLHSTCLLCAGREIKRWFVYAFLNKLGWHLLSSPLKNYLLRRPRACRRGGEKKGVSQRDG